MAAPFLDPAIFGQLKQNMDEQSEVHDRISEIVQRLSAVNSYATGLLSRVHATRQEKYPELLALVEDEVTKEVAIIKELNEFASKYPYYKYNQKWEWCMNQVLFTILLSGYMGSGFNLGSAGQVGRLLTPHDVSKILQVPLNSQDHDVFHITTEEYLMAVCSLADELARLATNSVVLKDYGHAVLIEGFVKELFAGFLVLNLKNDQLRRRVDGVKYAVKKTEEIVYDLMLRNLVPAPAPVSGGVQGEGGAAA